MEKGVTKFPTRHWPESGRPPKLTLEQVRWAIQEVKKGRKITHVAKDLGVSRTVISGIVNGRDWRAFEKI